MKALGLWCLYRGRHDPERHILGAFQCSTCGKKGTDFSDFGFGRESGYVAPMRKMYDRKHGVITTTSRWEPSSKGW
jgi:hypothetical protein